MIGRTLPLRRLLLIVALVLFGIYYFPISDGRGQTTERSHSTLGDFLPIFSRVTETVHENLTEISSTTSLVSSFAQIPTATDTSLSAEASAYIQASEFTEPATPTDSATPTESVISTVSLTPTEASADLSNSIFATAEAPSSNLVPSDVPEVVPEDHFYIDPSKHRTVFSISATNGEFFQIDWRDNGSYNPNILPHPTQPDRYVLVAQLQQSLASFENGTSVMQCTASFVNGVLACSDPPIPLPIVWTPDTFCPGDRLPGPHDPRVFYGPNAPYIFYGSRSTYSCHGMWIQDLQQLLPEFNAMTDIEMFPEATDVQRPPPYREIEKNYFLFWDDENNTYVHQDISPGRIFTSLYANGSVGPDLAPAAQDIDEACMSRYMPKLGVRNGTGDGIEYETIHQTTNSLAITLCRRSDPDCRPSNENTFIMVIFQHKSFYAQHAEYFPYVMLFQQTAPFAVHALSTKSIWIHGRTALSQQTPSLIWQFVEAENMPTDQSEMFFVVSMSWKRPGQMYHGYMDDELFLGFGIEDSVSAGIDILAGDLLQDLAYCSSEIQHMEILDPGFGNESIGFAAVSES